MKPPNQVLVFLLEKVKTAGKYIFLKKNAHLEGVFFAHKEYKEFQKLTKKKPTRKVGFFKCVVLINN